MMAFFSAESILDSVLPALSFLWLLLLFEIIYSFFSSFKLVMLFSFIFSYEFVEFKLFTLSIFVGDLSLDVALIESL